MPDSGHADVLATARALAAAALQRSAGDPLSALVIVSRTAALLAAGASAGFLRLPPRQPGNKHGGANGIEA